MYAARMLASQITAVTVFREGATVTRVVEVEGPGLLLVSGFPLCMEDRIRVEVNADLVCADARVELCAADPGDVEDFDAELSAARGRVTRLKASMGLLDGELARLRSLSFDTSEADDPLAAAEARTRLLDFRRTEVLRALTEREGLLDRCREAEAALEDVGQRRDRASSARKARTHQLTKVVRVRLEGQGSATLRVHYEVPGATWASTLQLRFDGALSQAEVRRGVLVRQRTGEHWKDVRLRVSTARPSAWTELRELQPLRVGRAQAPVKSSWRPPPSGVEELFGDYDQAFQRGPRVRSVSKAKPAPEAAQMWAHDEETALDTLELADAPMAPPAPPPMPSAAPAPRVQAKRARTRSPSLAGAVLGVAAGGVMAVAESAALAYGSAPHRGGGGRAPDVVVEAQKYRDLAGLEMADAEDSDRGTLQHRRRTHDRVARARRQARELIGLGVPTVAVTSVDGFDHAWSVPGTVDVPADGSAHAIALERATTDAELTLVIVPRETREAFRQVTLTNRLPTPLLPGPAEVYVAGRYLLSTRLGALQPGEHTQLGLGVEQGLEVARNATFKETSEGLLVSSLHLKHTVEVALRSNLDRAVEVEVRERIPVVSEHEDDVKVVDRGDWAEWSEDDGGPPGGRRWRLGLAAGEQRTLTASYEVELPGKHELVGGNRREP